MEVWNNINYTSEISYLANTFIYEMDISKCNINILFIKKVIDKDTYDYLYNAERMVRQVYVGKLQKDINIVNILKQGVIEAKHLFFEANDIKDNEVLCIKNDAVFIISRLPKITQFGLINFVNKNTYTGFYRINNLELYYYYNNISKEEYLHTKGISDENIRKHKNFFHQFLKDLFYSIQCNGIEVAMRLLKDFYIQYITLNLPIGYYRRYNNYSDYHFKMKTSIYTGFCILDAGEDQKQVIDISENLKILLELQKILLNIYNVKYK